MSRPRSSLTFFLTAATLFAACPNGQQNACPDACPRGQICDTNGQCVPSARPVFEESNVGAVGLDLSVYEDRVFISSIDPVSNGLIVTEIDGPVERRVLHTFEDSVPTKTAIASNEDRVAVVWREGQNFVYASRAIGAVAAFWDFEIVTVEGGYLPSDAVDLVMDRNDQTFLSFKDDDGSLRLLTRDAEANWTIETVDVGGLTAAGRGCNELREGAREVGVDPSLRLFNDLVISYFDEVCGDLRIARRVEGSWVVDIVDEGEDLLLSSQDRVGRFSSVTKDLSGNLHISYFDETRGRLMLATEQDGRFGLEVVDDGIEIDALARTRKIIVGAFTGITISNDGVESIVYYDASNQSIKLAQRESAGAWILQTLDANNIAGMNAMLEIRGSTNFLTFQRLVPAEESLASELVWRELDL